MSSVMHKTFPILLFFWVALVLGQNGPYNSHATAIESIFNGMEICIDENSPFDISELKIRVNGKIFSFDFDRNRLEKKVLKRHPNIPALVLILEKNGKRIKTLYSLRDIFDVPKDCYNLFLNVDPKQNTILLDGNILVLTKELHSERNKFNKVANGVLTRASTNTNTFFDEDGMAWELQPQCFNGYHNPLENVKLLHKNPGGGEYETIRKVLTDKDKNEGVVENSNCGKFGIGAKQVIKVIGTKLTGCNVTDPNNFGSTYNFGHTLLTNIIPKNLHDHFDVKPHKEWQSTYNYIQQNDCYKKTSPTAFLIDRSGSMGNNGPSGKSKLQEAQTAAINAITSMQNSQNNDQEVAFLTFSGGCTPDPTAGQPLVFSNDFMAVRRSIMAIPCAGGGTPLQEAVNATTTRIQNYVGSNASSSQPKLIVLSDGAATCGQVRPTQVYGSGMPAAYNAKAQNFASNSLTTQNNSEIPKVASDNFEQSSVNGIKVKYHTIGFDIRPGSKAERDLQYLASQTGGKYLNTQNEQELTRAFLKFFTVYKPKPASSLPDLDNTLKLSFETGVRAIASENYTYAKTIFEVFTEDTANDANAIFNLALMYEANDYHLLAIEKYETYLKLSPEAIDKEWVLKQIELLKSDRILFLDYSKKILASDLEYLKLHFEKIQNGQSVALADEFKGFIKEKGTYYDELPIKLGIDAPSQKNGFSEIAEGLKKCANLIKDDPTTWDKNATPPLSLVYFNLEKLISNF